MLKKALEDYVFLANPWLNQVTATIHDNDRYIERFQISQLAKPSWDDFITVLTGPRQSGKTTLGKRLCQYLLNKGRYQTVLYLNCDEFLVREWLTGSHVLVDLQKLLKTNRFILFIDEVQRLENPGIVLKSIFDLKQPIKILATGSSQLEIKSKVQEHLTGRDFESLILPLSFIELDQKFDLNNNLLYGCYPKIVLATEKKILLQNLFQTYINKDIIETLKIKNADVVRQLLVITAHSSGQLVNYQQFATDCRTSSHHIQQYLNILENTYVLSAIKPFVGNKRSEVTSNPIYYFLDNGFRNQALNNFSPLESRVDLGLLIESAVYQEIRKFKSQYYCDFDIHYWRTKGGAEVDFVLSQSHQNITPIEVKYRNFKTLTISRSFRSFIEAYHPRQAIIITKEVYGEKMVNQCRVHFIPFQQVKIWTQILINAYTLLTGIN